MEATGTQPRDLKLNLALKIGAGVFIVMVIALISSIFFNPSPQTIENNPSESSPSTIAESTGSAIPAQPIKLLFTGDVMLARSIGEAIVKGTDPFADVKTVFSNYNLVCVNLETAIASPETGRAQYGKLYTFKAPVETIASLKNGGVGLVNLANNHSMDYGTDALTEGLQLLSAEGIAYVGAGSNSNEAFAPKVIELNGVRIAFIAVNEIETYYAAAESDRAGSAYFDRDLIAAAISEARNKADLVIILPHWGNEYQLKQTSHQQEWARFFIDSGADLVIGNHPHVIQGEEMYKDKHIYYSLGNFVFDQMTGSNTSRGNLLEIEVSDKNIGNTRLIPITLNAKGFPYLTP